MNVGIGSCSFVIDEDAYQKLDAYLTRFRSGMDASEAAEVMEDVEQRIAELFLEYAGSANRVITLEFVDKVIEQLGYPENNATQDNASGAGSRNSQRGYTAYNGVGERPKRRLYRNREDTVIGGVCSGLAAYCDMDVVLFRVLAVVAFLCGSVGFWVYIILWIAVPAARTATEKCEMRGLPVTAENLRRFSGSNRR